MTDPTRFEARLIDGLGRLADRASVDVDALSLTRSLAAAGPAAGGGRRVPASRLVYIGLVIVATIGASLVAGGALLRQLAPQPPATSLRGELVQVGTLDSRRDVVFALRLADDRVLIAGATSPDADSVLSWSAEIWDPATGQTSPAGPRDTTLSMIGGLVLADGRVLVVNDRREPTSSGDTEFGVASAEIYDPQTGVTTPTRAMSRSRPGFPLVRLDDGRVLATGGSDDTSAEIYDPATGTFALTGSMTTRRGGHTATLLADGRVLVAGGHGQKGPLASAEIYDPATGRFSPTGPMTAPRASLAAFLSGGAIRLPDGRVLIIGGAPDDQDHLPTSVDIYDPTTGLFAAGTPLPHAVSNAVLLPDGSVLVAGTWFEEYALIRTTYDPHFWAGVYDPTTGMTREFALPHWHDRHAVALADGRVLFAGGYVGDPPTIDTTIEVFE